MVYIYLYKLITILITIIFFAIRWVVPECLRNLWAQRAALLQNLRPIQDEIAGKFQGFLGEFEGKTRMS